MHPKQENQKFKEFIYVPVEKPQPDRIEVIVSRIEPTYCNTLMKDLSYILPLRRRKNDKNQNSLLSKNKSFETFMIDNDDITTSNDEWHDLSHLRRIHNIKKQKESNGSTDEKNYKPPSSSPIPKKQKTSKVLEKEQPELYILLGTSKNISKVELSTITSKYNLIHETRIVPGRAAESKEELKEFNKLWPTLYFHTKTIQYTQEAIPKEDFINMDYWMKECIQDGHTFNKQWNDFVNDCKKKEADNFDYITIPPIIGAIIVNPVTNSLMSSASKERYYQINELDKTVGQTIDNNGNHKPFLFPESINPLCTSIILAIQGVSRNERSSAMSHGMNSQTFQRGQYLCTGLDMYVTKEPTIYEAMALLHSRIRRVIFGTALIENESSEIGAYTGTTSTISHEIQMTSPIHSLPGANHHYRVFQCSEYEGDLYNQCLQLHSIKKS